MQESSYDNIRRPGHIFYTYMKVSHIRESGDIEMKQAGFLLAALILAVVLSGCSVKQRQKEGRTSVEYTMVDEDSIPEGFLSMIEEEQGSLMCLTWQDESGLYIARGYGEQPGEGYSIEVTECSARDEILYIHTSLIGPEKDEKTDNTPTWPYIVIKVQEKDKNVIFE